MHNGLNKQIQHAVLVFDSSPANQEEITQKISEQLQLYKDNPIGQISVFATEPEGVEVALSGLTISNNQMQPTS